MADGDIMNPTKVIFQTNWLVIDLRHHYTNIHKKSRNKSAITFHMKLLTMKITIICIITMYPNYSLGQGVFQKVSPLKD